MPIYEYRCTACGHELEALQKLSEPALTTCPSCQADTLAKRVSAAGFQLKGSGWYATDFKNGSKPAAGAKPNGESKGDAKSESRGDAPGASQGESKSESKSESTADGKAATAAASSCGAGCACH